MSNFAWFKAEFRRQKSELLVKKFACGVFGLGPEDLMELITPEWNVAFSKKVNKVGWERTGSHPFTWGVTHIPTS